VRTPFFTNSTEPVADADITHRRHAIIETLFADLIDGPLAHMPDVIFSLVVACCVDLRRCLVAEHRFGLLRFCHLRRGLPRKAAATRWNPPRNGLSHPYG